MAVKWQSHADFAEEGVSHGFFGRHGGVSSGIFSSLNCGVGSGDDLECVIENRSCVSRIFDSKHDQLMTLHQIHSDKCMVIDTVYDAVHNRPQADALVTDKPGILLGILTADCAPVLFSGRTKQGQPVIGAAHAGWTGALKGVLENTVSAMIDRGLDKQTLKAVIGPCIGPQSYEVSQDFRQGFMKQTPGNDVYFKPALKEGHFMFDLPAYCAGRLALMAVPVVVNMALDTYSEKDDFFSFRRATHNQESDYGRQISTILIKG